MLVALGTASRHGGQFLYSFDHGRRASARSCPMLSSGGSRTLMRKTRAEPPRCQVPQHFLQRFQRAPGRLSLPLRGVWRRPGFSSQGLPCLTILLALTMYPVASPIQSRTNWVPGSWVWNHRNAWSSKIARLESRQAKPRVARRLRFILARDRFAGGGRLDRSIVR